jgi:hypothetical protein
MASVIILFTPDKKAAANDIAQAGRAAGLDMALAEVSATDGAAIVERAGSAPAAILIWSRQLVSTAVFEGWLGGLRRLPGVIEVSTDSIAPDEGDAGRVVLLSGWRGQPFHHGWQKVLQKLEPLRGPPAPRAAPSRVTAEGSPAASEAAPAPARAGIGRFAFPALALAAVAAAAGAVTWGESAAPELKEVRTAAPVAVMPPPQAASAPPASESSTEPYAAAVPAPTTMAAPAPQPPARQEGTKVATTSPRERAAPAKPRVAKAEAPPRRVQKAAAAIAPAPVKRYSKKHSKTMRRFCAASGRNTPECRTFLRSMRAGRS